MDSLRTTLYSYGTMTVCFTEWIPFYVGLTVGVLQIIYLLKKIKEK